MKFNIIRLFVLVLGLTYATSCQINEVVDLDNPTVASVTNDASKPQLQILVTGLEARHRTYFGTATQMYGSFGREVWAYFGSDPRFISEWLGIGKTNPEATPDFFGSQNTYNAPWLAVKQANVLIEAAENSTALSTEEANGYSGFAKTIKAYQMIWPLMSMWDNGIRIDVEDPLNPGPFVTRAEALKAIRQILDDGFNDLQAGGSTFSFTLSSGFAGFNTPAGMAQVNRAIAARLALYDGDWQGALNALNASFFSLTGDFNLGPKHVYGEAPDVNNPLYYPFDRSTNTILIAHPTMIEDALPGDKRVEAKFAKRILNPVQNPGLRDAAGNALIGEYQDARWATNITPIPFIRNEELILIYAEAHAQQNNAPEAVKAINAIRLKWGLSDYTGATDTNALIEEILFQRRYSLWAEGGHRWIDLRRTGRLNDTYIDLRDRGIIYTQIARPAAETNWDAR